MNCSNFFTVEFIDGKLIIIDMPGKVHGAVEAEIGRQIANWLLDHPSLNMRCYSDTNFFLPLRPDVAVSVPGSDLARICIEIASSETKKSRKSEM